VSVRNPGFISSSVLLDLKNHGGSLRLLIRFSPRASNLQGVSAVEVEQYETKGRVKKDAIRPNFHRISLNILILLWWILC
jgi:hypothetical protein